MMEQQEEKSVEELVDHAASKVAESMANRAPSGADGIWRFDRIIGDILGSNSPGERRTVEQWRTIENVAREKNARRDTWDREGYGIVACYAQTMKAYATPGFAEARSKWMT